MKNRLPNRLRTRTQWTTTTCGTTYGKTTTSQDVRGAKAVRRTTTIYALGARTAARGAKAARTVYATCARRNCMTITTDETKSIGQHHPCYIP